MASLSAPPERTTQSIALVQSVQILGQMVGPALGGVMADHLGIRAAFFGSSALAVIAGFNMLVWQQRFPQIWRVVLSCLSLMPRFLSWRSWLALVALPYSSIAILYSSLVLYAWLSDSLMAVCSRCPTAWVAP
jgi:MFS family permease